MDYLYENLTDERFQELCQAIISQEFSNSQIFPVGQPDGGRDSLVYSGDAVKKTFSVFQIKFVRNPYQIDDVHKWLVKTIEGEIEKIKTLIPRGATNYYLLTNVKGTAHLDSGSIDKLNKVFEDSIPIPSFAWWRDDLSRRFENNVSIKWSYPEILNGQDILNSNLFQYLNESRERRENVIRAYLVDQYDLDNEVKFRQIELQNHLLDLFVDVPIRINKYNEKNKELRQALYSLNKNLWQYNNNTHHLFDEYFQQSENNLIGTAKFLLSATAQNKITRSLIEGGPGQGKSTISQYVCQVHRVRLLNKHTDLVAIPEDIHNTPIRLPFKIDLRDIASWLEKKNPYPGSISDEHFNKIWHKSLEAFIVGHIFYHSKLDDFNSNDFIAICKHSAVLIVFDGFDEIANIKLREEVIEFINKGINRIEENSASLQVVITSRPAAFSNSIGFSSDIYPHFELTDVPPSVRKEYVEKWIKSKRLGHREATSIRKLVEEKLEQPHLKDLAKSPMQLAILISLLSTRGESLPNKRTSLYDSYIELFFNRESEKSSVIRDNRDLIIDIHQYLAWILHSEAELLQNSGRIELDELKMRLKSYLENEGHKTDIADKLFNVVKERVCALVSRVQGTFEFEVQPLREYFCAKHLYKTSPYSPVGNEKRGTKPERFDAIAKNLYWQNVVRFFAGCFDKGELPLLIQKLTELQDDPLLNYTSHTQILTSQLLSDWVFTQYPILLKNVVKIILNSISAGAILNQSTRGNNDAILIPAECGREEVIHECFNQLKKFPPNDYATELIGIINNNPEKKVERWIEHVSWLNGEDLTDWFEYAYYMQIIYLLNDDILVYILNEDSDEFERRLQLLIDGNKLDLLNKHPEFKELALKSILNSNVDFYYRRYKEHSFNFISLVTNSYFLASIFDHKFYQISFLGFANQRAYYTNDTRKEKPISDFKLLDQVDNKIKDFLNSVAPVLELSLPSWQVTIEPWDYLANIFEKHFGQNWSLNHISIIAAGIKSKDERFEDHDNFDDEKLSLCKRVRCARLKSGNHYWWKDALENTSNIDFALVVCLVWCTPKTLIQLYPVINSKLEKFGNDDFQKIADSLKKVGRIAVFSSIQQKMVSKWLDENEVAFNFIYLLSLRFPEQGRNEFIYKYFKRYEGNEQDVLKQKLDYLLNLFLDSFDIAVLGEIKEVYKNIKKYDDGSSRNRIEYYPEEIEIPIEAAQLIMSEFNKFPQNLARVAERVSRRFAYKHMKPVGEIAKKERWFES